VAKKEPEKEPEPNHEPVKRRKLVNSRKPIEADLERFAVALDRDLVNKIDIARRDLRMDRCEFATLAFKEFTKKYVIQRKKDDEVADSGQETLVA
jgi:hypothetical protein